MIRYGQSSYTEGDSGRATRGVPILPFSLSVCFFS